jgi:GT2 family glycosyltransferase
VSYVIITAARNEEAFIGNVIESVLAQTVHPLAWVIVSDGSTDGTDDIVKSYADRCSWIRYLRRDVRSERNFANKIHAFDLAYQQVRGVPFEFIGNLDADIVVPPTYYENLLGRFISDPKLGLTSGFIDQLRYGKVILEAFSAPESVPHGAQLVRRTCFEQIGGYLPLEDGGEDWCAQVSARTLGWNTSSFPEIRATELRDTEAEGPVLARRIKEGRMDYSMGSLPAFELIKCMRRVRERPFVVGAMTRLASYCLQSIRRAPRPIPPEVIRSLRKEQRARLWGSFPRHLAFSRRDDRALRSDGSSSTGRQSYPESDSNMHGELISIVYVNWNSADYLKASVKSVFTGDSQPNAEIIVVDNASTQDGVEGIAALDPRIRVFAERKNLGFAGANNLGASRAHGEILLFLNPDTNVSAGAIDQMARHLERLPDAGVLGARLLNADGSVQLSAIQVLPTILNQAFDSDAMMRRWPHCSLWRLGPLFQPARDPVPVDIVSGACMMMRKSVFERVGGFSEEYFMYVEDFDLCYKVAEAGLRNYYCGDATVVHYGGGSSARQSVNQWATRMNFRAMVLFLRKTRGATYALAYRLTMFAVALCRLAVLGIARLAIWRDPGRTSLRWSLSKWITILGAALRLPRIAGRQ